MTNLYNILETNTDETLSQNKTTKKVDILFDFVADKQTVLDTELEKNIVCVCGSCDLVLEINGIKETVTLNDHKITVHLNKNIQAELKNFVKETRVAVEYLKEGKG